MSADSTRDKVTGKVKEGAGKVSGDEQMESEGKAQHAEGRVKEGLEDAKATAKGAVDAVKDKLGGGGDGRRS